MFWIIVTLTIMMWTALVSMVFTMEYRSRKEEKKRDRELDDLVLNQWGFPSYYGKKGKKK